METELEISECERRKQRYSEMITEFLNDERLTMLTDDDWHLIEIAVRRSFAIEHLNIADLQQAEAL